MSRETSCAPRCDAAARNCHQQTTAQRATGIITPAATCSSNSPSNARDNEVSSDYRIPPGHVLIPIGPYNSEVVPRLTEADFVCDGEHEQDEVPRTKRRAFRWLCEDAIRLKTAISCDIQSVRKERERQVWKRITQEEDGRADVDLWLQSARLCDMLENWEREVVAQRKLLGMRTFSAEEAYEASEDEEDEEASESEQDGREEANAERKSLQAPGPSD